jgi:hypothetical protein
LIKIIHSNESLPKRWDIANERSDDDVLKTGVEVTGMFYTINLPSLIQSSTKRETHTPLEGIATDQSAAKRLSPPPAPPPPVGSSPPKLDSAAAVPTQISNVSLNRVRWRLKPGAEGSGEGMYVWWVVIPVL